MTDDIKKTLKAHGEQLELIASTVLSHSDKLKKLDRIEKNMATKSDIRDITNTLDVLVKLAQKKDQELTFMGNRVKRIEDDVKQIKPLIGLAV